VGRLHGGARDGEQGPRRERPEPAILHTAGARVARPNPHAARSPNWYLWGPPAWDRSVGIFVGRDSTEVAAECDSVRVAGVAGHPLAMPYERGLLIVVARGFRPDLAAAWKRGKNFN